MKIASCMFLLLCALTAHAVTDAPVTDARIVAEQAYDEATSHYETNKSNVDSAWQFACACFDLADLSTKNSTRAAYAQEGIDASRAALKLRPNSAAAHYYLGMNIAQLAQTKTLGALSLVRQMETQWNIAVKLDRHVDFAGPDRNLGLLYRDAPGAPLSIGSRVDALQHLLTAVALNPEYPENHLNLIESQIKWGQIAEAQRECDKYVKTIPQARKNLTGPKWAGPWHDWDIRLQEIQSKLRRHGS